MKTEACRNKVVQVRKAIVRTFVAQSSHLRHPPPADCCQVENMWSVDPLWCTMQGCNHGKFPIYNFTLWSYCLLAYAHVNITGYITDYELLNEKFTITEFRYKNTTTGLVWTDILNSSHTWIRYTSLQWVTEGRCYYSTDQGSERGSSIRGAWGRERPSQRRFFRTDQCVRCSTSSLW